MVLLALGHPGVEHALVLILGQRGSGLIGHVDGEVLLAHDDAPF